MSVRRTLNGFALAAAIGLAPGCSTSNPGSGNGAPAALVSGDWENDGSEFQIRIASFEGECAVRQASSDKANSTVLEIDLPVTGTTVAAGTYTLGAAETSGEIKVWDDTCQKTLVEDVTGTVTIDASFGSGSTASGSYSVQLSDGSTKTGSFSVAFCDTSMITSTSNCAR